MSKTIYESFKLVSRLTGVVVPPNKPIVSSNAFAHESGIHQHGMMSNPETYEIMATESVGAEKQTALGKHWPSCLWLIIWQKLDSNLSQKRKSTTSSLNSKNWQTVKNKHTMMTLSPFVVDNLHHKKAFGASWLTAKLGEKGYAYADVRPMTP